MSYKLKLARIEDNIPISGLASFLFGSESLKISDRTYLKISSVSLSFTGNMTSSMMPSSSSRWNSDISGPETFSYRPRAKRILGIQRVFIQTQTLLLEAVSREILHNTPRTDDGRCQTEVRNENRSGTSWCLEWTWWCASILFSLLGLNLLGCPQHHRRKIEKITWSSDSPSPPPPTNINKTLCIVLDRD